MDMYCVPEIFTEGSLLMNKSYAHKLTPICFEFEFYRWTIF